MVMKLSCCFQWLTCVRITYHNCVRDVLTITNYVYIITHYNYCF